jgi:hypothetical protein
MPLKLLLEVVLYRDIQMRHAILNGDVPVVSQKAGAMMERAPSYVSIFATAFGKIDNVIISCTQDSLRQMMLAFQYKHRPP